MTALELLEAIGALEDDVVLAAHRQTPRAVRSWRKTVLIAAAIAAALLLVGCTVAYVLNLQKLKIASPAHTTPAGESLSAERAGDTLSLQGVQGTPGHQAAAEWNAFLEVYDPDGTLLDQAEAQGWNPPVDYMSYVCYTQEMVDKIDAICQTYGLELLGPTYVLEAEQLLPALGIDTLIRQDAAATFRLYAGYCYRDGTFQLEGDTNLLGDGWQEAISYQYRCVGKTTFDGVNLMVGDIQDYVQWTHPLPDGTTALLALSPEKGLVFVDQEDFFISINVLNPSVNGNSMRRSDLEAFADTFSFSYTPQRPDVSVLEAPEWFDTAPGPTQDASSGVRNYQNILDYNAYLLESSRIRWGGQTYVYLTPGGMADYDSAENPGNLTYDPDLQQDLTADNPYLEGAWVFTFTGGLSDGLLEISAYIPELGDNVSALYTPEGKIYPQAYEYRENGDGSITILKYRGTEADVVVPSEIDGKPVTAIGGPGEGAFSNCAWVTSVTIPEGVTLVQDNAFYCCIRLEQVFLPASLREIGRYAFNLCPALTAVYFSGDAPAVDETLFDIPWDSFSLYRQEGTTGWDASPWSTCKIFDYNNNK